MLFEILKRVGSGIIFWKVGEMEPRTNDFYAIDFIWFREKGILNLGYWGRGFRCMNEKIMVCIEIFIFLQTLIQFMLLVCQVCLCLRLMVGRAGDVVGYLRMRKWNVFVIIAVLVRCSLQSTILIIGT